MKLTESLLVLSLSMVVGTAFAVEAEATEDNVQAYCTEQAQLAGIEDNVEREEYITQCIESYSSPAGNYQPAE